MNGTNYDAKKGERIEKRIRIIIKIKILDTHWNSNYDKEYHKKNLDEMNSTTLLRLLTVTEVCHSRCKEVTGVSLTFSSKCGPLQSSLVILLVLLDLSSWDLYDDTDIVIIEALIWV